MKNIRIIPRLDIKGPNLVKGIHLEGLRVLGQPEFFAQLYYDFGADELIDQDIVEIADALTDILYVTYGAGNAFGIDLDTCFTEVHRSNMSKLGIDGKPIYREDGKVLKGRGYTPPQLAKIIQAKLQGDYLWAIKFMQ